VAAGGLRTEVNVSVANKLYEERLHDMGCGHCVDAMHRAGLSIPVANTIDVLNHGRISVQGALEEQLVIDEVDVFPRREHSAGGAKNRPEPRRPNQEEAEAEQRASRQREEAEARGGGLFCKQQ
jgi:hypothetical protein